ncbi:MAG: heterodisulfide reductase-related iron-sulfur binding cluster [Sulfobacillus sp.]|nr:heterodisulfide reductase-related iron-sulfur binding cluster [Sulfobacillus sp.]
MWPHLAYDACLKCQICLSACPVYWVEEDFPGPKAAGPDWYRRAEAGDDTPLPHVDDCTFCQLCEKACPADVPIAHLIAEHKARLSQSGRMRMRDFILKRPHWVARYPRLGQIRGGVAGWMGLSRQSRRPRIYRQRTVPRSPVRPPVQGRVGLFIDCFNRGYDEVVIWRAEALLNLWGYEVVRLPAESRCCGAAAYAGGDSALARRLGRETALAIESVVRREKPSVLVTLNATCDGTLRDEWPTYYGLSISLPVIPFEEFAWEKAPEEFWAVLRRAAPETSLTHTTCRGQVARGNGLLSALAKRAGWEAVHLPISCCGAGGSYAFKAEHEATAHRLAETALPAVSRAPSFLMVDSGTCAVHLQQVLGIDARHPAYWLYERYQEGMKKNGGTERALNADHHSGAPSA